jgi:hypothetical protein
MGRRLGNIAGWAAVVAVCSVALFALLVWFGLTPLLAAAALAALYGAAAMAWVTEFMFRKSFPNLFSGFEKKQHPGRVIGDGDK